MKEADRNFAVLEWTPPRDGADVTHYVVEKWEQFRVPKMEEEEEQGEGKGEEGEEEVGGQERKMSKGRGGGGFAGEFQEYVSKWLTALSTDDDACRVRVGDLAEGHTYRFRLRAHNASGHSEPSESSEEVVCKAKQRPVIERSSLPDKLSVSRGEDIHLTAKFRGDPPPERSWHLGKSEVGQLLANAVVQDKPKSSKLTLSNADREKHQGRFEFRVWNEFGKETALVDVVVRTRPEKPRGPLRIDDVTADGCLCAWAVPDDDGGSPVLHYVVEKETR